MACFFVGAVLVACGGSNSWDLGDGGEAITGGQNGGCGTLCTSDQQCQQQCMNSSSTLYCCDLTASVGGMGLCYVPPSPSTSCPAAPDAGRSTADAGRTTVFDAGRRR